MGTEYRVTAFGKVEHHSFRSFVPGPVWFYQSKFRSISPLIQVPRMVTEIIRLFSVFPRSLLYNVVVH